ncbi:MAG: hypothetical protein OMM_02626 [Candidatus Magnetoglobus multicellularis str. Araruama]|uniref:B12-binding domain-containing protein n=1 Tax=Candidatus Magnetoglobus multicellularis str. Araruama TaxID=890399 RepID=A0A1V1P8X3_9BACT|nr:MAG: hypothetical protein OMM_02626 [Candidatus Magnetoglobus multicellularis str. Araruama]
MINKKIEIVLIHPGDKRVVYQDLATTYSAIQPPVWCGILASVLKAAGFNVQIIDANALNLSPIDIAATIKEISPLLVGIFVSGVHPSASTQTMPSAIKICKAIKNACDIPIVMAGLHPSALPKHTLETTGVDFVIQGDGLSSFPQLLHCLKSGSDIKIHLDCGFTMHQTRSLFHLNPAL